MRRKFSPHQTPELIEKLAVAGCKAMIERAVVPYDEAFKWNCPQHITPKFTLEQILQINALFYAYIEKMEAETKNLKDKAA